MINFLKVFVVKTGLYALSELSAKKKSLLFCYSKAFVPFSVDPSLCKHLPFELAFKSGKNINNSIVTIHFAGHVSYKNTPLD